jgi:putative ABC transport system permease protein
VFLGRVVIACGCAAALATVVSAWDVRLKPDATPDVLVSRQLLAHAHLTIGDVVTVAADPAGARAAQFRVAGVYEPTPDPMKFNVERLEARLHLDDLLSLTADPSDPASNESVTSINVALADPAGAATFSRTLAARLLLRANPAADAESATFTVIDRFHTAIAAVTVLGSTAFLLALMVIRAEERKETVGILRLIGISRKSILIEVIIEGLLVAIGGAVFGVTVALLAQRGVNLIFQARYDTTLVFVRVTPAIALRSVVVAVPVGVIAGAVASWTLLRRDAAALVRR